MTSPYIRDALDRRADCRAEYEALLEAHIAAAEAATRGVLLSDRGKAAGVDVRRLFLSNPTHAAAWASEELRDYWRDHPRVTFAAFERQRFDETGGW